MKIKIILLLLLFCCFQKGFAQKNTYLYVPAGENLIIEKVPFQYSNDKILVGFLREDQKGVTNFLTHFSYAKKIKKIAYYTTKAELSLVKGLSETEVIAILTELKKEAKLIYAYPFIISMKDSTDERGLTNTVIVKLKKTTSQSQLMTVTKQYTVIVSKDSYRPESVFYVELSKTNTLAPQELANTLYETNLFEYAEVNYWLEFSLYSTTPPVNDPWYTKQWGLENLGMPIFGTGTHTGRMGADIKAVGAWKYTKGCGVKIAAIDTGVDLDHPDLKNNLLPGYDATGDGSNGGVSNPSIIENTHGTNIAGIIAAEGNNELGMVGVAYESKIVPIRALYFTDEDKIKSESKFIVDAFNYAAFVAKVDIINCSAGRRSFVSSIADAINDIAARGRNGKGCIIVAATGNDNKSLSFPANLSNVISVGASNECDERKRSSSDVSKVVKDVDPDPLGVSCDSQNEWGSNYGEGLDLMAPGTFIVVTDIYGPGGESGDDYVSAYGGTSLSAPFVSGVAALVLSANPALTRDEVFNILFSTTDKMPGYFYRANLKYPTLGWNNETGYGRVNAEKAVKKAIGNNIVIDGPEAVAEGDTVTYSCVVPAGYSFFWDFDWHRLKTISFTTNSITVRVVDRYFDKSTYTYKTYEDTVTAIRVSYNIKGGACLTTISPKYVWINKEKEVIRGPKIVTNTEYKKYQIHHSFDGNYSLKWVGTSCLEVVPTLFGGLIVKNSGSVKGRCAGNAFILVKVDNNYEGYHFVFNKNIWVVTEIEGNPILNKREIYRVNLGGFVKVDKWTVSSNIKIIKQDDSSIEVEPLAMSGVEWIQAEFDGNTLRKDITLAAPLMVMALTGTSRYAVYPNPSEGAVFIKNSLNQEFRIEVQHTQLGKVYEGNYGATDQEIKLDKLPTGVYCITIVSEDGFVERKLVVVQ